MPQPSLRTVILSLLAPTALAACAAETAGPGGNLSGLTIRSSASAAPSPSVVTSIHALSSPPLLTGDPSAMSIGMYALYISPNADCSNPVLVEDYGSTPQYKNFVANDVLFSATPTVGTYPCVAIKMSDIVKGTPATSYGACVAGVEYPGDIYRVGDSTWKDINLNPIIGTGSDSFPVDDHVTIFMSTDTLAVLARGVSSNQLIPLGSSLIVPGQSTFYWNAQGSMATDGVDCGLNPGQPEFR